MEWFEEAPLPQALVSEQRVLAICQYDASLLPLVADRLVATDFTGIAYCHPTIWQAMRALFDEERPMDLGLLVAELEKLGCREIRGRHPLAYLNRLWQMGMEWGPDAEALEENARLVRDTSLRRRMRAAIERMAVIIQHEQDAEDALAQCVTLLDDVGKGLEEEDLVSLPTVLQAFLEDLNIRQRERGKLVGVPTGLDDLDAMLGGLQRGEMVVLGGRPGEGKTSLLLNILYYLISHLRTHIAFFTLEMSGVDLTRRLISMDTGINSAHLRTRMLDDQQWDDVADAALNEKRLAAEHVFLCESPDMTPARMQTKLRRHCAKHGPLDAIIVDYMQLMQGDQEPGSNGYAARENETQELSRISRSFKKLAKRFNCPVLVVASLRKGPPGKRPELEDLRGTGTIAYDCDVAMFISRSVEREGYSIINVEKHRNGPVGDVTLKFDPTLTRFRSLEEGEA